MVPTAVACFVLPLRSMHQKLDAEKSRLLGLVGSRMQALFDRLHQRVDQGIFTDAGELHQQIASLVTERDVLARMSTWPWDPATLTGFVSALVLPAFLWVLQRVLERVGF